MQTPPLKCERPDSTQGQNRPQDPNVGAEARPGAELLLAAGRRAAAGVPLCRFWTSSALW